MSDKFPFKTPDEIEDATIIQDQKPNKDELIQKGLLPPKKEKKVSQTESIQEIPVEQMFQKVEAAPNTGEPPKKDPLIQRAENRGAMAVDLIKVMIAGPRQEDVDGLVKYAFSLVDSIQKEVDSGYLADVQAEEAKRKAILEALSNNK